eukprot:2770844-Prorocentrum_lima.AAC.1
MGWFRDHPPPSHPTFAREHIMLVHGSCRGRPQRCGGVPCYEQGCPSEDGAAAAGTLVGPSMRAIIAGAA